MTFPFDRGGVAAPGLMAGGGGATGTAGPGAAAPLPCEVSGRGAGAGADGGAGGVLGPESGMAVRGVGDAQPQSASEAPKTNRTSDRIPMRPAAAANDPLRQASMLEARVGIEGRA